MVSTLADFISNCIHLASNLHGFHDEISGSLNFANDFLEPGGGDPSRWMLGIGLTDGFEQQTSFLDVVDVTLEKKQT